MLYDWLVNLPEWAQVTLAAGSVGLFSLAVTSAIRRVIETRRRESHNEVVGLVFAACTVLYALQLGFAVLVVYNQYAEAGRTVNQEAATLVTLYADTERYPDPPRSAMQAAIRQYTRSVVEDEFPSMARGRPAVTASARLNQVYRVSARFRSGDPNVVELNEGFNNEIDQVTLLRQERLRASHSTLPWTLWLVLVLGAAVSILLAASLFMAQAVHHLLGSFLLGVMIGTILFLILLLDRPFTGTTAIGPSPFERSLEAYALIDQVNR